MAAFPDDVNNALAFLKAYPYPAYVLETAQKGSRVAVQLEPIWSNPAYDLLIPPGSALLSTLSSYTAIVAFGSWAESFTTATNELPPTHLLKLDLGLDQIQPGHPNPKVELEVTKTELSGFLICTSIPRTPLPIKPFLASRPKRKRKRLPNDMKLLDLPSMTFGGNRPAASVCGSTGSQSPSGVPIRLESGFVTTAQLMETFDWASTALGPRETWPIELHTLIKYINGNPHPVCLHILLSHVRTTTHPFCRMPFGGVQTWSSYTMTPMLLWRLPNTLRSMGKEGWSRGASSGMSLVLHLTSFSRVTPSTRMMVSQLLTSPYSFSFFL